MRILFDVSRVEKNRLVSALFAAYVRSGKKLPDLYANTAEVSRIRKFLAESFPGVRPSFFVEQPNPYAEMIAWLERGVAFKSAKGGKAFRMCAKTISTGCHAFLRIARWLGRRSIRKNSLLFKYDAFLAVYNPPPPTVVKSGLKVISVLPNPAALKWPQKFLFDTNYDWMRARFRNLTADDIVIPAFDTNKEDMLVYGPALRAENVLEVAYDGSDMDTWADGVVNMAKAKTRSHYINNWHNAAPRSELPRIVLVGDIAVMRFRSRLASQYNVPVDGFSTSLKIDDPRFEAQFRAFLYSHPYKYSKAVFMVGNQIGLKPLIDIAELEKLEAIVGCEAILASPLPAHMQEKKYVGEVLPHAVVAQRDYMATLASRLGWRFVDVFQYVMEDGHSDVSTAFCSGRSHIGMSNELRTPDKTVAKEIMSDATALLGMALDMEKDDGPSQKDVYQQLFEAGRISPGEAKLEFEEWETLTVNDNSHCRYFFVGGCLLRDCCAASVKLKSKPTSEVYTSSHSIADPAYIEGLKCMTEGKTYDVAYFNFGAHFFLHTREEFIKAFEEILALLEKHARKVVLLTLPELASTGEADREECDFKNEKIRWANDRLLTVYAKKYPVVPVHQMALKYAARRCDYFHFERSVYDELFKEIQEQIGEPAE